MSPQRRKIAFKRSDVVPFGCLRIFSLYKQGIKARRSLNRALYALMNEIKSMERQQIQSDEPEILRWEKVPPFGTSVLRGSRSHKDYSKSWNCLCGAENEPLRRRLFDIPALQCRFCGREVTLLGLGCDSTAADPNVVGLLVLIAVYCIFFTYKWL